MTEYSIVPTTAAHIVELAQTMRKADVAEVWASSRKSPREALEISAAVSRDTRTGLVDGKVACIFGVCAPTALSFRAYPWLLGSDLLTRHAKAFLRMSRDYVQAQRKLYSEMKNYVDARNIQSIRWLRWLGFDILEPILFGPDQIPFHPFEMNTHV